MPCARPGRWRNLMVICRLCQAGAALIVLPPSGASTTLLALRTKWRRTIMNAIDPNLESRYARSVRASKAVRWEIEKDVIRGRSLDASRKFMPDGLSLLQEVDFLSDAEKRFAGQIQGRTYANIFGLVERFITAKFLEIGRDHWLGDQDALEALVRFSDEELKHQALFRRVDDMMGETLPVGYRFDIDSDQVARAVLDRSTW